MRSYHWRKRSGLALICLIGGLLLVLGGCASKSSDPYTVDRAYRVGGMERGSVIHVGETLLTERYDDDNVLAGAATGGVAGGVAGIGNPLTIVGGAVVGAAAGAAVGDYVTEKPHQIRALTITVETDGGDVVTVVQEEDDIYVPGDRVGILYERDRAQVRHL